MSSFHTCHENYIHIAIDITTIEGNAENSSWDVEKTI